MALTQTPTQPPKVFIDSSVLVAAAISQTGAARLLLTAGLIGDEDTIVAVQLKSDGPTQMAWLRSRAPPEAE